MLGAMDPLIEQLVRTLGLERHPEGGLYREWYRCPDMVTSPDGARRPAATSIYFLLVRGEASRWHRVAHDEVWHFYEGDPLELTWIAPDAAAFERHMLGRASDGGEPAAAVPAGCWQSASTAGDYSLVGCTVAPGFAFEDFALMADDDAAAAELRRRHPELAGRL